MNRATTALVLGIVGLVCCPIAGPVAWYMGQQELSAIRNGAGAESDRGLATAGLVLGILGTIYLAIILFWVFFAGGLAVLGALAGR